MLTRNRTALSDPETQNVSQTSIISHDQGETLVEQAGQQVAEELQPSDYRYSDPDINQSSRDGVSRSDNLCSGLNPFASSMIARRVNPSPTTLRIPDTIVESLDPSFLKDEPQNLAN